MEIGDHGVHSVLAPNPVVSESKPEPETVTAPLLPVVERRAPDQTRMMLSVKMQHVQVSYHFTLLHLLQSFFMFIISKLYQ